MVSTQAYGTWPSPIDAELTASHDGRPEFVGTVGDEVWWTEPRPAEGGRRALVRRRADGSTHSVLPEPWNPRSRVIEYGGTPWAGAPRVEGGPLVVFVHFPDQRLYAYAPDGPAEPWPLTPVSGIGGGLRWVEPQLHLERDEVWCVLEEFTGESPTDVRRVIAAVPLDGSAAEDRTGVRELTDGRNRFVTGPRLSHDGRRAAWITWDHPQMPWDGTVVKMADVTAEGEFTAVRPLVGDIDESVVQVEWDRDGSLLFVSDVGGWWELQRIRPDAVADAVVPTSRLCSVRNEEFGGPLWKIGLRWFQLLDNGLIAVIHGRGTTALGVLDPETGELVDAVGPWTAWAETLAVQDTRVVGIAASPHTSYEVVELDTATGHTRTIGVAHRDAVDPSYHPEPQIRTFAGPGGREIHAHVYPPRHPDRTGPDGELPPYVIWAHGGPTGRSPVVLDLETVSVYKRQGYGRAYRERLRGQWGVVDVEDCAAVALGLAEEGSADRDRLAIRGGSAGGWTAAASLTQTDVYACGAISYPILDLEGWATGETHDFESQYLESLVGPYDQVPERYRERSPVNHTDGLTAPFVLLQGLDDPICPPVQCERFLTAIEGRGIPHAYLAFEGEAHGFRRADTVKRALEAELSLYAQTFGIDRPDVPRLGLTK
ncbi:prolyl oligopeptidase family serine peptidase [Streptomyces sp. NRRL S-15]|uniref:prolyl oligopeptidase family serine peptidase n=1 Tax=Streptomyces sp. NRRL S-15 TaxID=1463886 RepID=UPI0004C9C7C5|nr:prolyl oligopeptidase family serine peptidase [Streptomyces sp. NRRL S-15]